MIKKIMIFVFLLVSCVSCSNQPDLSLSQIECNSGEKSESDTDIYPTLEGLYSRDECSSLVKANIDQIYTDVLLNAYGEKYVMLKLLIEKDLYNCTKENIIYLPIFAEYLSLTKKMI